MRLYLNNDLIKAANPASPGSAAPKATKAPGSAAAPAAPKTPGTSAPSPSNPSGASKPAGSGGSSSGGHAQPTKYFPKSKFTERPINAIGESPHSWILPLGEYPKYADKPQAQEKPGEDKPAAQAQNPQEVPATPEQQQEASQGNADPYSPNPQGPPPQDPAQQASGWVGSVGQSPGQEPKVKTSGMEAASAGANGEHRRQAAEARTSAEPNVETRSLSPEESATAFGGQPLPKKTPAEKLKESAGKLKEKVAGKPKPLTPAEKKAAVKKKLAEDAAKEKEEKEQTLRKEAEEFGDKSVAMAKDPNNRSLKTAVLHSAIHGSDPKTAHHAERIDQAIQEKIHDLTDDELKTELPKLEQMGSAKGDQVAGQVKKELANREKHGKPQTTDELAAEKFKEDYMSGYKREKLGLDKLETEAGDAAKKQFEEASEKHSEAMASNEAKVKEYTEAKKKQNAERDELTSKLQSVTEKAKTLKEKHKQVLDEVHGAAVKEVEDKIADHKAKLDTALDDHAKTLETLKNKHDVLNDRYRQTGDKNLLPAIKDKKEEIAAHKQKITETKAKATKELTKLNGELSNTKKNKSKAASDPKAVAAEKELAEAESEKKETSSALSSNKKQKLEKPELDDVSNGERSPETPHEKQLNAAHKADAKGLADNIESHLIHNENVHTDSAKQAEAKQLLQDLHAHANYEGVPTKQHAHELKTLQRRARQLGMDKTHAGAATGSGKGSNGTSTSSSSSTSTAAGGQAADAQQPGKKPSNPMEHAAVDSHRRKAHTMMENAKTHLKHDKNMDPNTRKYLEDAIADGGALHRAANSNTIPTKDEEKELREHAKNLKPFSGKAHPDSKPKRAKEGKSASQTFKQGMASGAHLSQMSATAEGGADMVGGAARGVTQGVVSGGHKLLNAARNRSDKNQKNKNYDPKAYSYDPDDGSSNSSSSTSAAQKHAPVKFKKTKDASGQEYDIPDAPPPIKKSLSNKLVTSSAILKLHGVSHTLNS